MQCLSQAFPLPLQCCNLEFCPHSTTPLSFTLDIHLLQALCTNTTLRELFLYENGTTALGDQHLLQAMKQNTTLTFLDLQHRTGQSEREVQNEIQASTSLLLAPHNSTGRLCT